MDKRYMIEVPTSRAKTIERQKVGDHVEIEEIRNKEGEVVEVKEFTVDDYADVVVELETHEYRVPTIDEARGFDDEGIRQFNEMQDQNRESTFKRESEKLFFEEQRGDIPVGTYQTKVDEIRMRFPKI